jgi:ankyrin repeat protein
MVRRRQTSLFTRWFGALLIAGQVVTWQLAVMAQQPASKSVEAPAPAPVKLDFDKKGPQPGDELPDLSLRTMKGEPQRLSDAWKGGPALLVTSSLTCPKSRSRWPELKTLVEKYDGKLNIVIVYVIEAHPVGSICPYKGVEDITPENERDGILRTQPQTEADRLELAQEFKRLLRIQTPIYVDNVKDEAWKALGGAPNLALLVTDKGIVVARQGWFEGKETEAAVDSFFKRREAELQQSRQPEIPKRPAVTHIGEVNGREITVNDLDNLIYENDLAKLRSVLEQFPELLNQIVREDRPQSTETTVLMMAIRYKNTAAVKLLLDLGASANQRTTGGIPALVAAASNGNIEAVKLLLEKGANPNDPARGDSPLHVAAINGQRPIVELLLSKGLRHDLYSAIALGEVEMVRKGLNYDPSRALRPDGAGCMPMDYAAANGQLEIAEMLLSHGAPLIQEKRVTTSAPLHRAIRKGQTRMVEWLLNAGSSPDTALGRGGEYPDWTSPLHMAISEQNVDIVKVLLEHKADLKQRNPFSQTALHASAASGATEIVKALLQAGADPNARQMGYELPCGSGEEENPTYTTPLHFAARDGNPATIAVLLAGGAKLDGKTAAGETPLMQAVEGLRYRSRPENSILANVTALLDAGADITAKDRHDRTVLDFAEGNQTEGDERSSLLQREIVALLKERGAKSGQKANNPQAPASEE